MVEDGVIETRVVKACVEGAGVAGLVLREPTCYEMVWSEIES